MAEVTTICKRTVVSTKPVQPGKPCPLSVLDRLMEQSHLNIVYYFATPGNRKVGQTTKKLRESLSEMLTCFPMVTGRLVKNQQGQWTVKCNDAGVRMVEAKAKGNLEDWLKTVDREKELTLVCWEEMFSNPYFWSTFYVQLTEFEEGGVAIGLSCTHLLADPTCATMFIKAWADTTIAGKMLDPPLFHPLPDRRPISNKDPSHTPYAAHLLNYYKSSIGKTNLATDTKYASVALAFTDVMVRSCMDMARTTSGVSEQKGPSPFDALAGLFWVSVCKARGIKDMLTDMSICLDVRKVLGLDKGFFGNCMIYNKIPAESLQEKELAGAAKAIGETIAKLNYEGVMDLIEWLQRNGCRSPPTVNGHDLVCANLENIDPYLAVFEEGFEPLRASYYVEPVVGAGQVLILRGPPSEGLLSRAVVVTLPEDEMVKLCEDNLIQCFSPTILLGPK